MPIYSTHTHTHYDSVFHGFILCGQNNKVRSCMTCGQSWRCGESLFSSSLSWINSIDGSTMDPTKKKQFLRRVRLVSELQDRPVVHNVAWINSQRWTIACGPHCKVAGATHGRRVDCDGEQTRCRPSGWRAQTLAVDSAEILPYKIDSGSWCTSVWFYYDPRWGAGETMPNANPRSAAERKGH